MTLTSNILLGYNNYIPSASIYANDAATETNFDLTNALNSDLYKPVIFSSNSSVITFTIDLGKSLPLHVIGLLKHNIMYTAKWRIYLNIDMNDDLGEEYDSGWMRVVPSQPGFGGLPWGAFQWGDSIPEYNLGQYNRHSYYPLPDTVVARYITISIDAIGNPELVRFFHLWASVGYQPSINVQYGTDITIIDQTRFTEAASGARQYGDVVQRRQMNAGFSDIPRGEMLYNIIGGLYLASGISKPILAILEPKDPTSYYAEAVYGNLKQIDKAVYASWLRWDTTLSIEEAV